MQGDYAGLVSHEDQLLREIGAVLDHPSLYMGGASRQSLMKAAAILPIIEREKATAIEALTRPAPDFFAENANNSPGLVEKMVAIFERVQGYKGDEHAVMARAAIAAIGVVGEVG